MAAHYAALQAAEQRADNYRRDAEDMAIALEAERKDMAAAYEAQRVRAERAEAELDGLLKAHDRMFDRANVYKAALERMAEALNVHAVYYAGVGGVRGDRLSHEYDHVANIARQALGEPND
jgi:hypothetical protein